MSADESDSDSDSRNIYIKSSRAETISADESDSDRF